MPALADLTLHALSETGCGRPGGYARTLRRACALRPPPFGMAWYGDAYRRCARKPRWVAESLVVNALKEAEGAAAIWRLAGMTLDDDEASRQIRRHAVDECRHARLYLVILRTVFPKALPLPAESGVWAHLPRFTLGHQPPAGPPLSKRQLTDAMIQMNIGEIRTRVNQLLATPVLLAYCSRDHRPKLCRILDALLRDETRHVMYTAALIERAITAGDGDFVAAKMVQRLAEIGALTVAEVRGRVFSGV